MKRILTVLAVGVILAGIAGCQSSPTPAGTGASPGPSLAPGEAGIGTGTEDSTATVGPQPGGSASPGATASGASTGSPPAAASPFLTGAAEVVRTEVPVENYHTLVVQAVASKYRPAWLDAYQVAGKTYFNAIFRPASGSTWYEYAEMTGKGYQSRYGSLRSKGYRLVFVESYLHSAQIRYAAIWEKSTGPEIYTFHNFTAAEYKSTMESKTGAGFLPAQISAVSVNGALSYTGLLVKRSLGKSWQVKGALTPSEYQAALTDMNGKGLGLAYVNAYPANGSVRFIAVFASSAHAAYQAGNGLTGTTLATQVDTQTKAGYWTRAVVGYDNAGSPGFIAYWSK